MATQLQKRLAKSVVDNVKAKKPRTGKELAVISGYSEATAEDHIPAIFEQKGFIEELKKLGFHEDNAKRVVAEVLDKGEDSNRLKAADMIFKVNATYAPERQEIKQTTVNINFFSNPKIQEATKNLDEAYIEYLNNGDETKKLSEAIQDK